MISNSVILGPAITAVVSTGGLLYMHFNNRRKTPEQRASDEIAATAAAATGAFNGLQMLSNEQSKNIDRNSKAIERLEARASEQDLKIAAKDAVIDRLNYALTRSRRIYRENIQRLLDHITSVHESLAKANILAVAVPEILDEPPFDEAPFD